MESRYRVPCVIKITINNSAGFLSSNVFGNGSGRLITQTQTLLKVLIKRLESGKVRRSNTETKKVTFNHAEVAGAE